MGACGRTALDSIPDLAGGADGGSVFPGGADNRAVDAGSFPSSDPGFPPLAGYWPFDEAAGDRAFDRSGNGNHGKILGASWTTGRLGGALSFNGLNTLVDAPCNDALDFGNGDFTVAAWILTTADTTVPGDSGRDEVLAKGDPYNSGFGLSVTQDRIASYVGDTGRSGFSSRSLIVNDGRWHHVAVTRERGLVKIFRDAVLAHSYEANVDVTVTSDLIIGRHGTKAETFFEGVIDDVRIYAAALSQSQLMKLATP